MEQLRQQYITERSKKITSPARYLRTIQEIRVTAYKLSEYQLRKALGKLVKMRKVREQKAKQLKEQQAKAQKAKQAPKINYFTTYKIILTDESAPDTHSTEYYTTITKERIPNLDNIKKQVQKLIDFQNANRTYKRLINKIKRVDAMNVSLTTAEQKRAFKKLITRQFLVEKDDKVGWKELTDEFTKLTRQFKLRTKIYRQICKINGIPDTIDKGNDKCAINFLVADVGYSKEHVEKWFDNKIGTDELGLGLRDWTADDLYDFAVDHNRSCFLLDRRRYCFKHFTGTSHQRDLYAIIEDNHVYPIQDETARRKIREMMKSGKHKKYQPKKSKKSNMQTDKLIVPYILNDDLENIEQPTEFIVTDAKDLNHALSIFLKNNEIPDIKYTHGNGITKVNFGNVQITHNPDYYTYEQIIYNNQPAKTSGNLAQMVYDDLINEYPLILSPIFGKEEAISKAKYHIKELIQPSTHFGIDFSKFYYNAAMSIDDDIPIPSFAVGSVFETSELSEKTAHYVIETQDWELLRGPGLYTYDIIKKALDYKIDLQITHIIKSNSTLKWKIIKDALQKIVTALNGDLTAAKFAIVKFIGLLAQSNKKTNSSYIIPQSTDDSSALMYYYLDELSRGKEVHIHPNWSNTGHHLLSATKLEELTMNAAPIHRMILNRSYEIIHDYMIAVSNYLGESAWLRLSAIKTDCLIFRRELWNQREDLVNLTMESVKIPSKIEIPRKVDKCNIITSFDKNTISVKKHQIFRESEDLTFDKITEMIEDDIKSGVSIRIEGIAGSGKSTIVNELIKKIPDINVISAASDWVSAKQIGGKTLHSEFNLGETTTGWFTRVKKVKTSNTVLVVDETSKVDNDLCAAIAYIKRNCLSFVALGDHTYQMLPIQQGKISNEDSINTLVDKIYILTVCKRAIDTQQPALEVFTQEDNTIPTGYNTIHYKDLDDLANKFIKEDFKLIICRDNQMKITLNELIAYKLYEQSPLNVEYDITLSTRSTRSVWIDYYIKLFPCMQLVAIKNNKKYGIIKTQRAFIKTFSNTHVTIDLMNGFKDITLTYEQMHGFFDLGYVINAYNSQSATYNFKHIIIQTDDMDARAKYVSLTRATAKNLIYIAQPI